MKENIDLKSLKHAQLERLAYIDYCLQFIGKVSRTSLIKHFSIGPASCSRDFAIYQSLAPNNLVLMHEDNKFYHRTDDFKPLFKHDPSCVLTTLVQGFGDGFSTSSKKLEWVFDSPSLITPDPEIVASLTRAINGERPVRLVYESLTSGKTEREIIPHAIINNGHRWHVRAYDRKTNSFRDFVCSRIEAVSKINSEATASESSQADEQWQKRITLELLPHPNLKHKKPVEFDYSMTNGQRSVEIRGALAGYLLRYWNVDCTSDASLNPQVHHLWLKNHLVLSNIANKSLCPGSEHVSF